MFAKANVNEKFDLYKINYYQEMFIYPFINQEIPEFIGKVPVVAKMLRYPSISELDILYNDSCLTRARDVEGFIINSGNSITKYVRMKSGKLQPHHA